MAQWSREPDELSTYEFVVPKEELQALRRRCGEWKKVSGDGFIRRVGIKKICYVVCEES